METHDVTEQSRLENIVCRFGGEWIKCIDPTVPADVRDEIAGQLRLDLWCGEVEVEGKVYEWRCK